MIKKIYTPLNKKTIDNLHIGDKIEIYGSILTGRDAALPKLVQQIDQAGNINLEDEVIMHTAVSPAGIAPTSSNKEEIEESIPFLAAKGVRMHLGKGRLKSETVRKLDQHKSIFVIIPPVAALLTSKIRNIEVVAFPEEGMEAIHRVNVEGIPGVVAAAQGRSLFDK